MNKRRGKALTGEFKNEVLHFGKLLAQFEDLVFFSVSLGGQEEQSLAVVLENFDIERCKLPPRSFADKINTIAEKNSFVSPIVELGITPDNKPFFISSEPSGCSLEEYIFNSKNDFKAFFNGLFRAFLALKKDEVYLSYDDRRMIYPDSMPCILFPAIKSIVINSEGTEESYEIDQDALIMRGFSKLFINAYTNNIRLFEGKIIDEDEIADLNPGQFFAFLETLGDRIVPEEGEGELSASTGLMHNFRAKLINLLPVVRTVILKFLGLQPKIQIGIGLAAVLILFIISGMTSGPKIEKVGTEQVKQVRVMDEPVKQMTKNIPPEKERVKEQVKEQEKEPEKEQGKEIKSREVDSTELPKKGPEGVRSAEIKEILSKIQAMGKVIPGSEIDFLIKNAKSDDFEIRIASIRTLGEKAPKGLESVRSALIDCLKDDDYLVRGFAVTSLTAYLEADSMAILESHKVSEESEVVVAAIDRAIDRLSSLGKVR
jgi:hypothetical protein